MQKKEYPPLEHVGRVVEVKEGFEARIRFNWRVARGWRHCTFTFLRRDGHSGGCVEVIARTTSDWIERDTLARAKQLASDLINAFDEKSTPKNGVVPITWHNRYELAG